MEIGLIGLGRMGGDMARAFLRGEHRVIVHDRNPQKIEALVVEGAAGAHSVEELVRELGTPRAVWVMLPSGEPTEQVVGQLSDLLEEGDIIIDGGNSYFKDDVRRARLLESNGIEYVDVGTSGGIWGFERGYCLMIGGKESIVKHLDPLFVSLAPGRTDIPQTKGRGEGRSTAEQGYLHCGPTGSGHFVKMVHNGIEYGLMQAYAEGFDILKNAGTSAVPEEQRYDLELGEIAEVWRRGSVISSWLLDLIAVSLSEDPDLSGFIGSVPDSGEGRWTVVTAIEEAVPADVISAALSARFRSRQDHTFAEKLLSAMRKQFGGHEEAGTKTP